MSGCHFRSIHQSMWGYSLDQRLAICLWYLHSRSTWDPLKIWPIHPPNYVEENIFMRELSHKDSSWIVSSCLGRIGHVSIFTLSSLDLLDPMSRANMVRWRILMNSKQSNPSFLRLFLGIFIWSFVQGILCLLLGGGDIKLGICMIQCTMLIFISAFFLMKRLRSWLHLSLIGRVEIFLLSLLGRSFGCASLWLLGVGNWVMFFLPGEIRESSVRSDPIVS